MAAEPSKKKARTSSGKKGMGKGMCDLIYIRISLTSSLPCIHRAVYTNLRASRVNYRQKLLKRHGKV